MVCLCLAECEGHLQPALARLFPRSFSPLLASASPLVPRSSPGGRALDPRWFAPLFSRVLSSLPLSPLSPSSALRVCRSVSLVQVLRVVVVVYQSAGRDGREGAEAERGRSAPRAARERATLRKRGVGEQAAQGRAGRRLERGDGRGQGGQAAAAARAVARAPTTAPELRQAVGRPGQEGRRLEQGPRFTHGDRAARRAARDGHGGGRVGRGGRARRRRARRRRRGQRALQLDRHRGLARCRQRVQAAGRDPGGRGRAVARFARPRLHQQHPRRRLVLVGRQHGARGAAVGARGGGRAVGGGDGGGGQVGGERARDADSGAGVQPERGPQEQDVGRDEGRRAKCGGDRGVRLGKAEAERSGGWFRVGVARPVLVGGARGGRGAPAVSRRRRP